MQAWDLLDAGAALPSRVCEDQHQPSAWFMDRDAALSALLRWFIQWELSFVGAGTCGLRGARGDVWDAYVCVCGIRSRLHPAECDTWFWSMPYRPAPFC